MIQKISLLIGLLVVLVFVRPSYGAESFSSNGSIYAVTQVEDMLYIGGDFTDIAYGSSRVPRSNIASFDLVTNSFTSWSPVANGAVRTIAVNYETVYVGGEFTEINGQPRRYIASFEKASGNLTDWSIEVNDKVYALTLDGPDLYVGGAFSSINNQPRSYLAIYDTQLKEVVTWTPQLNGIVYAVIIDNLTVYIGGEFTEVNGQEHTYLAAFDKSTGNLTTWYPKVEESVRQMTLQNKIIYYSHSAEFYNENFFTYDLNSGSVTITPNPRPVQISNSRPTGVGSSNGDVEGIMINSSELGFVVPNLSDILTFVVRGFFVMAGLAALFYLLLGAFSWVTSGGDKDAVSGARDKIQAAIVGVIMIVAVLAVVVTLEQIVFRGRLCFGLSCPASIPSLVEPI